jgi:ERCC4-type nuclease
MSAPVAIYVDGRETKLSHELSVLKVPFETRELSPGDVLFVRGEDAVLICERKTYADLSASIADGRFAQQRSAMKETGSKILYIIEGPNKPRTNNDARRVLGALENLAIVHNICVLPTASTAETALAIQHIQKKLEQAEQRTGDDVVVHKIVRRKDKIMANVMLHQLEVVNGVSVDIAKSIVAEYPTMASLVSAYEHLPVAGGDREKLLQDIPVGKRRVGPAVSQRIYQTMYGEI